MSNFVKFLDHPEKTKILQMPYVSVTQIEFFKKNKILRLHEAPPVSEKQEEGPKMPEDKTQ